jgi:hypothetical protein
MGPPALPFIQSLLEDGQCERAPDFLLAHAAITIHVWSEKEFAPEGRSYPETEQALCRQVLERSKNSP